MKATGIVRRIDDLGRVVIPKEIRRTLRIREGDPLQTALTPWERFCAAMKDMEKLFGLKLSGEETDRLVLTDYEVQRLRTAFDLAMSDTSSDDYTQEQYVLYGTYNPFSVTVTHILNNKSGVDFTSYSHTGLPVAVFADGNGADVFTGYYDNTEIYQKMASLVGVQ